jgi:tRNA(Ile)-lysidine synthase TilS/MesJ
MKLKQKIFESFMKELLKQKTDAKLSLQKIITINHMGEVVEPFFYLRLFPPHKYLTILSIRYFLDSVNYLIDYEFKEGQLKIVLAANVMRMDEIQFIEETIIFEIIKKEEDHEI